MKTAQEILTEVHRELNATYIESKIVGDVPVGERKEVALEAMKRYAYEVAKEALKNAGENARIIRIGNSGSYLDAGINMKSILSETNIPQEVKI